VDLVEDLSAEKLPARSDRSPVAQQTSTGPVPMAEYCAFVELGEARSSRDELRAEGIRTDILIRETPESVGAPTIEEEYWLRVELAHVKRVQQILGFDTAEPSDDGSFGCGDCGKTVSAHESFCPHCGARFDEE